MFIAKNVGDVF